MAGRQTAKWRKAIEGLPDAGFIRALATQLCQVQSREAARETGIAGRQAIGKACAAHG